MPIFTSRNYLIAAISVSMTSCGKSEKVVVWGGEFSCDADRCCDLNSAGDARSRTGPYSLFGDAVYNLAGWETYNGSASYRDENSKIHRIEVFRANVNRTVILEEVQRLAKGPTGRCSSNICGPNDQDFMGSRTPIEFYSPDWEVYQIVWREMPSDTTAILYSQMSDQFRFSQELLIQPKHFPISIVYRINGTELDEGNYCWACIAEIMDCLFTDSKGKHLYPELNEPPSYGLKYITPQKIGQTMPEVIQDNSGSVRISVDSKEIEEPVQLK